LNDHRKGFLRLGRQLSAEQLLTFTTVLLVLALSILHTLLVLLLASHLKVLVKAGLVNNCQHDFVLLMSLKPFGTLVTVVVVVVVVVVTSAKEVMFLPVFVCLSVCVCVCVYKITQKVMDGI